MILGITNALNEPVMEPVSPYNLRQILLVRTAQIIDAMSGQGNIKHSDEGK
jgi:hypothetical protein